jgi:hypothetical protein
MRLLRHKPLIGDQGVSQGETLEKLDKDAQQRWKDPANVQKFVELMARKRLEKEGSKEISEQLIQETAHMILSTEKKHLRSFFVSYPAIAYVKALLNSIIIRRDQRSLDPAGAKVLNLVQYVESIVYLHLMHAEREALASITNRTPAAV